MNIYKPNPASLKQNSRKYVVPQLTGVQLLSASVLGRLYGIGIGRAEAIIKNQQSPQGGYSIENGSDVYNPDAQPNESGGYNINGSRWDGKMSSSLSGMPVMSYLKFIAGNYADIAGNVIDIPEVTFETVVMSCSLDKNIEKTSINGRDSGTIKEYINKNDWNIEIRAVITSDAPVNSEVSSIPQDGVYPRENMEVIMEIINAPISLPVDSWYLQQLGVNYLVIESARIEQIEGEYSVQRLVLSCCSDNPLIIKIAQ